MHNRFKPLSRAHSIAAALLLTTLAPAQADDYRTTFDLAANPWNWTRVEFLWSTDAVSGSETDLDSWVITTFIGTTVDFVDPVILGGAVQPLGGNDRRFVDFTFDTGLGTGDIVGYWDNDTYTTQTTSSGVTYNLYNADTWWHGAGEVYIKAFLDGAAVSTFDPYVSTHITTQNLADIPEPSALGAVGLLGLAFPLAMRRRRRLLTPEAARA